MKVGIIGNMNNNHFSLMRYLRDLSIDAYLILYSTDGTRTLSHFRPESDTWDIDKWSPYIIQSSLPNGKISALLYYFKRNKVRNLFDQFDIIIGNGFAPAYCYFARRSLDMFLPYSIKGEFIAYKQTRNLIFLLSRKLQSYFQIKGLKATKVIGALDNEYTYKFRQNGLTIHPLTIPMLYIEECEILPNELQKIVKKLSRENFIVFSHLSHGWKTEAYKIDIKRIDLLIKGFAFFQKENNLDAKLVMVEYGHDIAASKELISQLGIEDNVIWLPKMSRKFILEILKHVDVGGNALAGTYWGGSGWEFLASGVPMIHYITEENKKDSKLMNWPPFFNTQNPKEIGQILNHLYFNPSEKRKIGKEASEWFEENQGTALANEYKRILNVLFNKVVDNSIRLNAKL